MSRLVTYIVIAISLCALTLSYASTLRKTDVTGLQNCHHTHVEGQISPSFHQGVSGHVIAQFVGLEAPVNVLGHLVSGELLTIILIFAGGFALVFIIIMIGRKL